MSPIDALWHVLLIPGAAAGLLALASTLLPEGPRGWFVAAFAVAAGYVAGCWATGARPALPLAPSDDAWTWTVWFAVAGALLGGTEAAAPVLVRFRAPLRFVAGVGAMLLILAPLESPSRPWLGSLALWLGILGVAGLWTMGAEESRRRPPALWTPPLLVTLGGAAFLVLQAGRSASMAVALAVLCVSVATVAATRALRRRPPLPAAVAPAVALPYVGLVASAYGYLNYGAAVRFPGPTTAALLIAPCAGLLLPRRLDRAPPLAAAAASVAAALLAIGLGALFAPLGDD